MWERFKGDIMVVCKKCGCSQEPAKFCWNCGALLEDAAVADPTPAKTKREANLAPVSIGQWIGVFFLSAIPLVNFILLIVWAANPRVKKSLRTYAAATLILMGVAVVLVVVALVLLLVLDVELGSIMYGF